MTMRTFALIFTYGFILLMASAVVTPAQRMHRAPRYMTEQDHEARRAFVSEVVAELKRSLGEKLKQAMLVRFEGMARLVARRLSPDELKLLRSKPISVQVKEVAARWKQDQLQAAQRFIKRQSKEVARELLSLEPEARDRRIAELKIEATLERAIRAAEKHQLIQTEEADRLRGLSSDQQLKESGRLNRLVFFAMHGEELSKEEKARLEKLSSSQFWRDRTVRRFRLLRHLDRTELAKLRKLGGEDRTKLFRALRSGKGIESLAKMGILSETAAANWAKMKASDRRRLLRDLMRVYLPQGSRGLRPSRRLMEQMSPEERQQLAMMNAKERLQFLKKKFPQENWDRQEKLRKLKSRIDDQLKGLNRRDRYRIHASMPTVAKKVLKEKLSLSEEAAESLVEQMEAVQWFRSVVPSSYQLRAKLKGPERKKLRDMKTKDQVDFLFQKFPKLLNEQAEGQLRLGKIALPEGWVTWSGSKKVIFLNEKQLRMPWAHGATRRGPHRRMEERSRKPRRQ